MLLEVDLLDVNHSTTTESFSVVFSSPFLLLSLCPTLSKGYAIGERHLLLHSLNAVTKESAETASCFRWTPPDPGLGAMVELSRGKTGRLLNLVRIGKA